MKINEITESFLKDIGAGFVSAVGKHIGVDTKQGAYARSDANVPGIKKPAPAPANPQKSPAASGRVKEKPGYIPFLDFNGQRIFFHQTEDRWYYYNGQDWPKDIKMTHPVEDDKSDAIAGLVASDQVQYAPWKPQQATAPAAKAAPVPRKPLRPARPAVKRVR